MMRIVHVEDCFLPSGGYQINFLVKNHVQNGHEVYVVTSDSVKPWSKNGFFSGEAGHLESQDRLYEEDTGCKIIRLKSVARISGREIITGRLAGTIKDIAPDVVFCHGNDTVTGVRLILNSIRYKWPIIVDNHMVDVASENKFRGLFRLLYRTLISPLINRMEIPTIVVEEDCKTFCQKNYRLKESLLYFIGTGTDCALFAPDQIKRMEFRKKLDLNDNDFVCIYTGKISSDKKVKLLAEAFSKRFSESRNSVLLVVGSGNTEYAKSVFDLLMKSENRVVFFGTQRMMDLPDFYRAADLAIWPGACSLSFYDAQASETPVLSENIQVNIDRMKNENGATFMQDSIEDLRGKINWFIELAPQELARMGINGRLKVKESRDYNMLTKKVEQLMIQEIDRKAKCNN